MFEEYLENIFGGYLDEVTFCQLYNGGYLDLVLVNLQVLLRLDKDFCRYPRH